MSDWRDQAECAGDPNPDAWHSVEPDQVAYAQAVCSRCLVAWECLGHAIDSAQAWGTWGGLSQVERDGGPEAMDPNEGLDRDAAIQAYRLAYDPDAVAKRKAKDRRGYRRRRAAVGVAA